MAERTARGARPARYAKGVARRAEIIDTTIRLMAERGYRKTSLRAIGRELGLEPAHVLHYFGSREKLFEAVIDAADERYLTVRPGVTSLFEAWLQLIEENAKQPGLVHLYTAFAAEAADPNHPSRPFFQARWNRVRRAIEAEIDHADTPVRRNRAMTSREIATALIAYSDGLQLQWLVDPTIDMRAAMHRAFDLMLDARPPV